MTKVRVGSGVSVRGGRPSNIKVSEDGDFRASTPEINFTGSGVDVSNDSTNNRVNVNISDVGQALINDPTVIVDGSSISLTTAEHTLTTSQATITVTDSYTGDYCGLRLTLSGITQVVLTFSTGTSLCSFGGTASGDSTMTVTGVSGDRVEIHRKKLGTNYTYVGLNVGQ